MKEMNELIEVSKMVEEAKAHQTKELDRIRNIKEKLRKKISESSVNWVPPDWLRGIGISSDNYKYFIKVNVNKITTEIVLMIPSQIDGIKILLEEVGEIYAST